MQRLITITVLGLGLSILSTFGQRLPPVPGLPANTDSTPSKPSTTTPSPIPATPLLLDNYIPPVMQALAYYVELLQYEPTETTTLEPPFSGIEAEGGTTYLPPKTTPSSEVSIITTPKPWWQTTVKTTTTTTKPWTISTKPTYHTTTLKPSTIWWKPSSTVAPTIVSTITTRKPSTTWWQTTSTMRPPITTRKPSTTWWQTTSTMRPTITTRKPSTTWWQTTSTMRPITTTTTKTPWWQTTTTMKPYESTIASWQTTQKPWWQTTTTTQKISPKPTTYHHPGIFAPRPSLFTNPSNIQSPLQFNTIESTTHRDREETTPRNKEQQTTFPSIMGDKNFFDWFFQPKAIRIQQPTIEYDFQRLDPLPAALLQDISYEKYELPALLDKDNVNEFLRVYDDSFGRYRPITGKKRIPPTKPYVDFLMLYDLLKRDAKAMNFSQYSGYTEPLLRELAAISQRSAERQLHTLLTRLLARNEVTKADVLVRVKSIIKDLENPYTVTSISMRVFPPLQFVP